MSGLALKTEAKKEIDQTAIAVSSLTRAKVYKITADEDNTGKVYIGDSNVTTDRYSEVLEAGESITFEENEIPGGVDPSSIFAIASADDQNLQLSYIA